MAAAGTRVGTGYVEIQPDFSNFQEKVGRRLATALAPQSKEIGKRISRDMAQGFDGGSLGRVLAPFRRRFEKVGDEAGKAIADRIGKKAQTTANDMFGLADAIGEVEKRSKKASSASRSLETDMFGVGRAAKSSGRQIVSARTSLRDWHREARAGSEGADRLRDRIRSLTSDLRKASREARAASGGFSGFDGGMARVNRSFSFFRNLLRTLKLPTLVAGIGLLAQGLSALAAGAVATTSALGPLAGTLVALPAAAIVAAQAFGALKLATAGVGDAIKAAFTLQAKGGEQAIDMMRRQEDATERISDAELSLADSHREVQNAQEALTEARKDARRELEDMRLAAEGAHDAEQQSNLSLVQARQELAKTLRDPKASGLDIRFAEEAVDQARRDVEQTRLDSKRARQDFRDTQKKGVEGMTQVKSAKESLADANRSVADAEREVAKAIRDQSDAMKAQGSAATALQQKMAELPQAGQKFVRFIVALKPRLDALRATAAEGFFPGAEEGIRSALGNFKVLRGIIAGTASAFGRLAAKAGRKLGSEIWGKDLLRLGKLNIRIIKRFGGSAFNLADAFRHVLIAAEPFLDWLSESTKAFTDWIKHETAAGRESGKLAGFFDRTRQAMELLGPILKGTGGALLNIGEAARPLGNEILKALGESAEGWRKWSDSITGKNDLRRYFTESKPAIFEMGKLIGAVGKAFFELGKQRGVAHLLRLVRTELIPAITSVSGAVTGWASDFLKQFGMLRKEGVPTFDAFIQVLFEHAGQAGVAIAKALGRAFLHAGIWGKLAITGWLIHKLGGFKALSDWGLEAGARLGKKFFKAAAKWIAGTETGAGLLGWWQGTFSKGGRFGKAASAAGTRMGRLFGKGLVVGVVVGLALLAPWIAKEIQKHVIDPIEDKVKGFLNDIVPFGDPFSEGPVVNGPDLEAHGISAKALNKKIGFEAFEVPSPKTDKAEAKIRAFSKTVGREADRARTNFRKHLDLLPGVAERNMRGVNRQTLPRLDELVTQGGRKSEAFSKRVSGPFGDLSTNVGSAIKAIIGNVRQALDRLGVKRALKQFAIKNPSFVYGTGTSPNLAEKQEGGFIVPGHGSGDKFKTMLPVGSFVENREAVRRLPFQGGGMLPVALEPGERVHFPERVRRIGVNVLRARNEEVPRFQKGGMLRKPELAGPAGALRETGRAAIDKVHGAAKEFVGKHQGVGDGSIANAGPLKAFSRSYPEHTLFNAEGRARFSEALVARIARWAGLPGRLFGQVAHGESNFYPGIFGIDPGGTEGLGLWQITTRFNDARIRKWGGRKQMFNPLKNAKAAKEIYDEQGLGAWYGLDFVTGRQSGGLVGRAANAIKGLFAGGGMVDPGWDPGGETIAGSIAQLVAEYAKRYDIDITAGYDPGGGHVSPGHNTMGTATDVVPRSGNWGGAFAKGLETLAKFGFEVGYDGSVPGTESWPDHGRGNHAHIEWVGNGTSSDARMRLREFLGGVGGAGASGPAAAPKEKIPPVYQGAKTGNLDFGPIPKNLEDIDRELAKWQAATPTYRKAKRHAEKHGKPGIAQALGENLGKIEVRLKALRDARFRLRTSKAKKALRKRITKALGKFAGYEQMIEGTERGYAGAAQYAEQVVGLEPQSPELPASATDAQREAAEKDYVARFTQYIDTQERPAYAQVLERVANWRNTILRAEKFGFGKEQPSAAAMETNWEGKVREVVRKVSHINEFSEKVAGRVRDWRANHRGQAFPDWLKKQVTERDQMRKQLPGLRFEDSSLRGAIGAAREKFFPGGDNRLEPPPIPLPGSGSFEEALETVQGIHWPDQHDLLPASALAPPRVAGRFGGVIWDLQGTIEELGLRISQAANSLGVGGGGGESEPDSDLEELLRQANQRTAVSELQKAALEGWDRMRQGLLPPFGGIAHQGAIVPGPSGAERTMVVKAGEGIFTEEQMAAMGGPGGLVIEQLIVHEDGRATARMAESDIEATVERVVRRTRGTGTLTPGGARR